MTSITIRDVPGHVHDELKRRAARRGQSLQQYLVTLLTEMASAGDNVEILARARERVERDGGLTTEQILEAIREGRR